MIKLQKKFVFIFAENRTSELRRSGGGPCQLAFMKDNNNRTNVRNTLSFCTLTYQQITVDFNMFLGEIVYWTVLNCISG